MFQDACERARLGRDWAPRDLPHTFVSPLPDDTFAGTLVAGEVSGVPLDVFVVGGDDNAKRPADLAASGGLRPIDAGPLRRARELKASTSFFVVSLMAGVCPEEARTIGWEEDVDLDGAGGTVAGLACAEDLPGVFDRHLETRLLLRSPLVSQRPPVLSGCRNLS